MDNNAMKHIKDLQQFATELLPPVCPLTTLHVLSATAKELSAATLNTRGSIVNFQSLESLRGLYEIMNIGPVIDDVCELQCRAVTDEGLPVDAVLRDYRIDSPAYQNGTFRMK